MATNTPSPPKRFNHGVLHGNLPQQVVDLRRIIEDKLEGQTLSDEQKNCLVRCYSWDTDRRKYLLREDVSPEEVEIIRSIFERYSSYQKDRSFFFFRRESLTRTLAGTHADDFFEQTKEDQDKLAALKQAIIDENLPHFEYEDIEAFGQHVLDILWQRIEAEVEQPTEEKDWLKEEAEFHELFMADRTRRFVGRRDLLDRMHAFCMKDDNPSLLIITGEPGCGKSALIARFTEEGLHRHPDWLIIPHFVGASPSSTGLRQTLRRLCMHLNRAIGAPEDAPEDIKELLKAFPELLAKAAEQRKLLIILDAVNQFDKLDNAHSMQWLPQALPKNVHLIISTLSGEAHEAMLARRVKPQEETIKGLTAQEIKELVGEYLKEIRHKFPNPQVEETFFDKVKQGNPLYIIVALEELRVFGQFEELRRRVNELPDNVPALFDQVLARIESDFNPILIRDCMIYLASGRYGMTAGELQTLLRVHALRLDPQVEMEKLPDMLWLRLYRTFSTYLFERAGVIDFFHSQLKEAVGKRYLEDEAERDKAHKTIADYFEKRWGEPHLRALDELPHQRTQAKDWEGLERILCDLHFLEAKCLHVAVRLAGRQPTSGKLYGGIYELQKDYETALQHFPLEPASREDNSQSPAEPRESFFLWRQQLTLLLRFLQREAYILEHEPKLLASHLYNQLVLDAEDDAATTALLARCRQVLTDRSWLRLLNQPAPEIRQTPLVRVLGHGTETSLLAWSPDGRSIASAGIDSAVILWDVATGDTGQFLRGHAGTIKSITWSSDGTMLATASEDATVRIWDPASGQTKQLWQGHPEEVIALAWSPGGDWLAAAASYENPVVAIWDIAAGRVDTVLEDATTPLAWSPDGKFLAVYSGKRSSIRVWSALNQRDCAELPSAGPALRWSPDGRSLAAASHLNAIVLWDTDSGQIRVIGDAHTEEVTALDWSPDGSALCSGSRDGVLKIWDSDTAGLRCTLRGHWDDEPAGKIGREQYSKVNPHTGRWAIRDTPSDVGAVAWSSCGTVLASAGEDCTVRVWDTGSGQCRAVLRADHSCTFAWSPDGTLLALKSDRYNVQIWDQTTAAVRSVLLGHTNRVGAIGWSSDGKWLASVSADGTIRIWDPTVANPASVSRAHASTVTGLALSRSQGYLASTSSDGTIRLWVTTSGEPVSVLGPASTSSWIPGLQWSPDGQQLATIDSRFFLGYIWDVTTSKVRCILEGHSDLLTTVAWSPDSTRLATASYDRTVRLWDACTGQPIATLEGHTAAIFALAWSPDGQCLASAGDDGAIRLWTMTGSANPALRTVLEGAASKIEQLAWSPDAMRLAASEDADRSMAVWIWDISTEKCRSVLVGATYPLAWSPDGVLLATRSCEDTIAVWDAATGQLKHLWEGHLPLLRSRVDQPQAVASHRRDETGFTLQLREEVKHGVVMAWSPTGSLLATAGWDRTVKVWNLHSGARLALACCLAPIYLADFTDDGQSLLVVDNGSATCNRPICYWLELSNSPAGESVQPAEPECSDLGENSLANELLAAKRLWRRLHPLLVGTLGEAHPEMFTSLASLAKTYELFQEHADAEWCYREGLTLLECFHGPDDVNVAVCCHNLASLCQGQGRLEEAAALYWRSLDILKKHGTNSDDQLIVLLNLGWLYHEDLQDYAQAELLFREAFELTRTAHGAVHPKTVESLYHLGTMLLLQDDHDRALDCFREAIDVIEQLDRPDARQLADVLDGLEALEPSEEVDALIQRTRDLLALLSGQIPPGTVPADGTIDPQQLAELLQRCTDQQGKFDRGAFDELGRQLGFTFIGPLQRDGKRYLLLTLKGTTSSQNFALEFSPSTVAKASAPAVPAPADSTLPLDQLIPLFWTHPEHAATWRHYFQNTSQRKQLLLQVLSHLPAELGQVSFVEDRPSDPFILLVTYDEESEGGRENAAQVFTVLANHGAVTFFGSEGAWGRCDVEWVRALSPDKDNIRELAWDALCSFKFHPVEYAAIVCDEPVALWGIEDQELYQKVKQTYKPGSPVFQELMHRRETVVWTNLLALMEQQGCVIAGASVTMGAFWTGHRLLQERNIAHAGIFCRSSGKHRSGYLDAVHQGQMKDDLSLEGRPDKPTPPTPLRHETVPLLNRPAWGERRHLPGSALIYFISLLVGVVICWWGSWGWLCGIPIIGLCGFLLVRLSLAASGWPMNVPCPRCGTSATLWRRRHIMCPCCGSVEC